MKLRRKLLSAGLAFGATALTLTTSTFAWYTANSNVVTGNVSGLTSTESDTSSLYISAAKTYVDDTIGSAGATWTQYATTAQPVVIASSATPSDSNILIPVAYDKVTSAATAKTYNTMSAEGSSYTYSSQTNAKGVYQYVLRFQVPNNSVEKPVYVSEFSVTNSASASDSQQLALADNGTLGVDASASTAVGVIETGNYNVDLLHALKMTVEATPLNFDSTATSAAERFILDTEHTTTKIYDLDSYATASKDVNIASVANAVGYYDAVLGTSLKTKPTGYLSDAVAVSTATSAASTLASTSTLFTIPSTTSYMEVRFTFWLDGWDEFCYDVCRKQNFSVDMQFSVSDTAAKWTTTTARTGKTA